MLWHSTPSAGLLTSDLCSPRNELLFTDWQLGYLLHRWQHPPGVQETQVRKPGKVLGLRAGRKAGPESREGRTGQAPGVQADGKDGSQEKVMQDGMVVPVPAGGTPGWDQMSLTGFKPFQLLNPLAEEIGSTALP